MPTVTSTFADEYVGVWNEPSPGLRSEIIHRLWAPDAVHSAGALVVSGYDALEQRITASHEKNIVNAGYRFRPAGNFAQLRNAVKFAWEMTPAGGEEVVSAGMVFAILADDGRILSDYLFVDA